MNQFKRFVSYAAISLVAIGTTSSAWAANCIQPNFGGGWKAYISTASPIGQIWVQCRLIVRAADGVIGNTTCTLSNGASGAFTAAKLTIVSSAACEFKAAFSVGGLPYAAPAITLADDHLNASGVGTYKVGATTYAFTVQMVKIS